MLRTEKMKEPGEGVEVNLNIEIYVYMDTDRNDTKQEEDHFHSKLEPTHSNQPAVAQTPQTGPAVAHFAEAARALQQLLKGSQGATRRRSKSERGARDRRSLGERRTESLRARC